MMFLKHLKEGCLLALLFLFSASAFAQDFYWQPQSFNQLQFPSPDAACSYQVSNTGAPPLYTRTYTGFSFQGADTVNCLVDLVDGFGNVSPNSAAGQAYRYGETCPAGTTNNSTSGTCEVDQLCENRPPILSDAGTPAFSNNGCNYYECGSIVDADNGSYNTLFCGQEGYCVDNILGCEPENTDPETNDLNNGCMTIGGQTICMDGDDNQCYEVDGVQQCFKQDSICGVKNGTTQCIELEKDNCGSFNGDTVCFEPNSETPEVIDSDSPDDPDNGGNADGDETNDVSDSRVPAQGGDSTNQPTDNNLSSKDKKQSKLDAQNIVNEMIKKGMWEGVPSVTGITDGVETSSDLVSDGILDMGQGVVDGIVSGNDGFNQTSGVESAKNNVLSAISVGGGCSPISIVVPLGYGTYYIDCFYLDKTRQFLSFLFYVFTALTLFYILTKPMESK